MNDSFCLARISKVVFRLAKNYTDLSLVTKQPRVKNSSVLSIRYAPSHTFPKF